MEAVDYWWSDFKFNWKKFISKRSNFVTLGLTLVYFVSITLLFKFKLAEYELIKGVQLTDVVLENLPRYDVSFYVFILLYTTVFYNYLFLAAYPKILEIFLFFYATSLLLRFTLLSLISLEPPIGHIVLLDPFLMKSTYNDLVITKDLFFSGHMVAMLCAYYTIPNRTLKLLYLIGSLVIGILLLIQHIHYVIDILGAVIAVYLLYRIYFRKQWLNSKYSYQYSPEIINNQLK
jgi:hypothetical protein